MNRSSFMFIWIIFQLAWCQPSPCFLKCKDNYMNGMQQEMSETSTEWTVDMVTPLQALLTGETKRGRLERRMERVCRLNTSYQRCLHVCPDNPAKRILVQGQKSWDIICDDFRNDTEFRGVVVPCWSDNGVELSTKCSTLATFLRNDIVRMMENGMDNINEGIEQLCKSVHEYDKCFIWQNYEYCGINAGKFLVKLTHQTSHALIDLLDDIIGVNELPKTCKEWLNQKGMTGWQKTRAVQRRLRNVVGVLYFVNVLLIVAVAVLL